MGREADLDFNLLLKLTYETGLYFGAGDIDSDG